KNPVHSVLWMLVMFFHVAGVYLMLNAEFLAATQIIVYAGAILVLFLFVIMLLNLREEITAEHAVDGWPGGLALSVSFLIVAVLSLIGFEVKPIGPWSIEEVSKVTQTKALGKVLYTEYLFPFEIASLVLLIAIVGAVVLAKKKLKS
ncbi:MAG: NADH-quinone oxidoreductase subunit J, partial [Nitrospirae bacterium]